MNDFVLRVMAWAKSRDRGASAVEYALILAVIVALLVGGLGLIGVRVSGQLSGACTKFGITC